MKKSKEKAVYQYKDNSEKVLSISWLRIAATIAVVFLHSCITLTNNADIFFMTDQERIFLKICSDLMVWAVPCFFMITGSLLLDEKRKLTVHDCIFKYVKRMIIVLFVFGVPMAMMILLFEIKEFSSFTLVKSFWMVINGETMSHLWYLYALIGIYLIFPVLKIFTDNCSRSTLGYILAILFIFDFCIPFVNQFFSIEIEFSLQLGTNIFYILLGKYIKDGCPKWLTSPILYISLGFIVSLIIVLEIIFDGRPENFRCILDYSNPVTAVYGMLVYLSFRKIQSGFHHVMLWKIDRLCFGVYLIHPVFIQVIYRYFHITPVDTRYYPAAIVLFTIFFVLVSFFGSWILSLIKPLGKYL